MQDILAQMQEKLKATGQVGPGIGLRGRVGSLGNDLDATDVEKKRNSIIDVWTIEHRHRLELYNGCHRATSAQAIPLGSTMNTHKVDKRHI